MHIDGGLAVLKMRGVLSWSRRDYSRAFAGVVFLAVLQVSLAFPLLSSVAHSIQEKKAALYGEQHAVLFGLSTEGELSIEAQPSVKRTGQFTTYGLWANPVTNSDVVLGSMDAVSASMGRIAVRQGRLPIREGEIALEEVALLRVSGSSSLGTRVTLVSEQGSERSFVVVGVLGNYSGQWQTAYDQERGENSFPEAFISQTEEIGAGQKCLMLLLDEYDDEAIAAMGRQAGLDVYHVVPNWKTYEMDRTDSFLRIVLSLLLVTIVVSSPVAVAMISRVHFSAFREAYDHMRRVGFSRTQTRKAALRQLLRPVVIGSLAGLAVGLPLGAIVLITLDVQANVISVVIAGIIGIVIAAVNLAAAWLASRYALFGESRTSTSRVRGELRGRISSHLGQLILREGCFRMVPMAAVISLIFFLIGLASLQIASQLEASSETHNPDFWLKSWMSASSQDYGEFEVLQNRTRVFSTAAIGAVRSAEGVRSVSALPMSQDTRLVLDSQRMDSYWDSLRFAFDDSRPEDAYAFGVPGGAVGIPALDYCVLDEVQLADLERQRPELAEALRTEGAAALFLPPLETVGGSLTNTYFRVGDSVELGRLEAVGAGDALLQDIDVATIRYVHSDLDVIAVEERTFELRSGQTGLHPYGPAIVMTERTMEQKGLFGGYGEVSVDSDTTSGSAYEALAHQLKTLAAGSPDFGFAELKEMRKATARFSLALAVAIGLQFLSVTVIALLIIFLEVRLSLLTKRKTLGIYRTLGATKRHVTRAFMAQAAMFSIIPPLIAAIGLGLFHPGVVLTNGTVIGVAFVCMLLLVIGSLTTMRASLAEWLSESIASALRDT
ncbi:MAG: hypothetical protein FD171_3 [Actinobacteria bacterium]|nr:MAG: hypothetical protein FD171_3 [Actinomycetota bacterium]